MTLNILNIETSPQGERSASRKLAAELISSFREKHPSSTYAVRDLSANPLPHLDGLTIGSFFTPADKQNDMLKKAVKLSNELVDELSAADVIIIAAPMYNFGIPSSLKAWIDHVVRSGRTFKNGPTGPEGLLKNKRAIVISTRGQVYTKGPFVAYDHQETYLKTILGFIGLTDIAFIRAEGLIGGEEAAKAAFAAAKTQIEQAVSSIA